MDVGDGSRGETSLARRIGRVAFTVGVLSGASGGAAPGGASAAGAEVGHWPMDESSGSVMIDISPSDLDGAIGKAVVLGGSAGYLFPGWTGNVAPPAT